MNRQEPLYIIRGRRHGEDHYLLIRTGTWQECVRFEEDSKKHFASVEIVELANLLPFGFHVELTGPGLYVWHKNLPDGSFVAVSGKGEYEAQLPPKTGPFIVCRYKEVGEEPLVCLEAEGPEAEKILVGLVRIVCGTWETMQVEMNEQTVTFTKTKGSEGYVKYKGWQIFGKVRRGVFRPYELEECGCCGGYHQPTFHGDCRYDPCRFPTWDLMELKDEEPLPEKHYPPEPNFAK